MSELYALLPYRHHILVTLEAIIKTGSEVTLVLVKFDHSRVCAKAIVQASIVANIKQLYQSVDMKQSSALAKTRL